LSLHNVKNTRESLLALVKKNSLWYKGVVFYCVIAKQEGKNILYRAKVIFQHKSENDIPDVTYDYEVAILARRKMSLDEFYQLIEEIPKKQVNVKDLKSIEVEEKWGGTVYHIASNTRYVDIIYDWPTKVFHLEGSSNIHIITVNDPMIGHKCPTFPNLTEATHSFLNLQELYYNNNPYGIQFLVPDYRARIKSVEISENSVRVVVDARENGNENLILKVHSKNEKQEFIPDDIGITSKETIIKIPFNFKEMNLFLVDKNENQIIDHITYGNYMTERHEGITIKTSTDLIESLIIKGENMSVEFKKEMNKDEFLESISSFANTKGGRIILGVDDRRNILGIYDNFDNLEKSIHGTINGRIEPHISIEIEKLEIQNKPLIIVTVNEGNDKPYIVKGKSAYVRVDEHDIPMTRLEFDKIYSEKHSHTRN
jgi:hypothetical protein